MATWFPALGITVERLLTNNERADNLKRFAHVALDLGTSQRFSQAYLPQMNGETVRFFRTLLTE